jgi:hypothetical protein
MKARKAYLFPALITFCLLMATALGIHGSSVAVFDTLLNSNRSSLIAGSPRVVRSDEWFVNTPFVLSQVNNHYPLINHDVGKGQDMSVVIDVPYKDWSIIFHPQNLIFFILPAINAFAFKWWFLAWMLMIAVYLFTLQLFNRRYLLASLLAIFMCFSPFIQWWYQSITILPIAYSLLAIVVVFKLLESKVHSREAWLYSGLTAYLTACFVMLMYPPFQIVCGLVAAGLFAALYLAKYNIRDFWGKRHYLRLAIPVVLGLIPVVLFVYLHREVISVIRGTVYPGSRDVLAGGKSVAYLLHWPLSYTLLKGGPATSLGSNQSEVSRFLFVGIVMLPTIIFGLLKKGSKIPKQYKNLLIACCLLLTIFLLNTLVPHGNFAYKFIGLNLVPHVRLVMGMGIINLVLIALAFALPEQKYKGPLSLLSKGAIITMLVSVALILSGLMLVLHTYAPPTVGKIEVVAVSLFFASITALLVHPIRQLKYAGLIILTLASVAVSASVNPIYHGFGAITGSSLAQRVKILDTQNKAYWISTDKLNFEPIPLAVGAETFSGVETYPQLKLWRQYFPGQDNVYNRYAHVAFSVDDSSNRRLDLIQADSYSVTLSSCDSMLSDLHINYIIANGDNNKTYKCFKTDSSYKIGDTTVSIFKRD